MKAENVPAYEHLQSLRAEMVRTVRLANEAAQGTIKEWNEAKKVARAAEELVHAEVARLREIGFDGDIDFEIKVMGRMLRRHTDPVMPPFHEMWQSRTYSSR